MLSTIGLKYMGSNPCVSEITGFHKKYHFSRDFLKARLDYTHANANGIGTVFWFILHSGGVYECQGVFYDLPEKFYIKVLESGDFERITKGEVDQWITKQNACSE